jgi:hypothetical protein
MKTKSRKEGAERERQREGRPRGGVQRKSHWAEVRKNMERRQQGDQGRNKNNGFFESQLTEISPVEHSIQYLCYLKNQTLIIF